MILKTLVTCVENHTILLNLLAAAFGSQFANVFSCVLPLTPKRVYEAGELVENAVDCLKCIKREEFFICFWLDGYEQQMH